MLRLGSPITVPEVMSYQPPILESELLDGFRVRYLKLTGLWATINHQRTTGKKNLFIKAKTIAAVFLFAPYVCFQFISYFAITVDLQKATFLTVHFLIILQILSKLLTFWFSMESICRLFDLARKDFLAIPEGKRPQVEQIFKKITKKTDTISLIISVVIISSVVLSIACPIVPVDYIAHRTGSMAAVTEGEMKILGFWYPVPMDQSPYYELIFAYEVLASVLGGTIVIVYICFFYQILVCLYAQFTVLGYLISTLKVDYVHRAKRSSYVDHPNICKEMYKELYVILKDHQKLLSYANELRSVYNPLITIILGMGIFVLVVNLFQFLFVCDNVPRVELGALCPSLDLCSMYYTKVLKSVCSVLVLHLFKKWKTANLCISLSSDLQFAIYSSDWYKADVNFRKSAQMLMVRARKGVTLTAIKMYPVNVETIMAIFQFTYSTTALMSRMSE